MKNKIMSKCDFCPYSDSKGKCHFVLASVRASYCEEAIEKMCKILKDRKIN